METYEYGAMSSKYSLQADNKLTAYAAMCCHFGSRNVGLIALYAPEENAKTDSWLNPFGIGLEERLDEIFGGKGKFYQYIENHKEEISKTMDTIKTIC